MFLPGWTPGIRLPDLPSLACGSLRAADAACGPPREGAGKRLRCLRSDEPGGSSELALSGALRRREAFCPRLRRGAGLRPPLVDRALGRPASPCYGCYRARRKFPAPRRLPPGRRAAARLRVRAGRPYPRFAAPPNSAPAGAEPETKHARTSGLHRRRFRTVLPVQGGRISACAGFRLRLVRSRSRSDAVGCAHSRQRSRNAPAPMHPAGWPCCQPPP